MQTQKKKKYMFKPITKWTIKDIYEYERDHEPDPAN